MFAAQLRESGYVAGMEKKRLVNAWNSRKMSGRAQQWLTVDAPPKTNEERHYRQQLLRRISQAADGVEANQETSQEADDGESQRSAGVIAEDDSDSGADEEQDSNGDRRELRTVSDAMDETNFRRHPNQRRDQGANSRPSPSAPLEMIHHGQDSWTGSIPSSSSAAFIDHEEQLYKLGGPVHRALIDGAEQDAMVCNRNLCAHCGKRRIDESLLVKTASKTDGLPFVHAIDLEVITRVGFKFKQDVREYNNKYPDDLWTTRITFSDGGRREVKVCMAAKCKYCSGEEAVDRRAARYLFQVATYTS